MVRVYQDETNERVQVLWVDGENKKKWKSFSWTAWGGRERAVRYANEYKRFIDEVTPADFITHKGRADRALERDRLRERSNASAESRGEPRRLGDDDDDASSTRSDFSRPQSDADEKKKKDEVKVQFPDLVEMPVPDLIDISNVIEMPDLINMSNVNGSIPVFARDAAGGIIHRFAGLADRELGSDGGLGSISSISGLSELSFGSAPPTHSESSIAIGPELDNAAGIFGGLAGGLFPPPIDIAGGGMLNAINDMERYADQNAGMLPALDGLAAIVRDGLASNRSNLDINGDGLVTPKEIKLFSNKINEIGKDVSRLSMLATKEDLSLARPQLIKRVRPRNTERTNIDLVRQSIATYRDEENLYNTHFK